MQLFGSYAAGVITKKLIYKITLEIGLKRLLVGRAMILITFIIDEKWRKKEEKKKQQLKTNQVNDSPKVFKTSFYYFNGKYRYFIKAKKRNKKL